MSKKFLVPIDMNGLEIQNFLAHNLASAPTGVSGKVYFNTVDHKLYYYNGTEWVDLTASTDTTYTLTQNGSTITLTGSDGTTMTVSGEANQNAFSNVKVGSTTVSADGKTDTLELVAGANVTLTPDATNDKVTIEAEDTTYSEATPSASGLMSASDKTKLNGIASGAEVNVQSDWNQETTTADDYIKNKPTLGQAAAKDVDTSIGSSSSTKLPTTNAVKDYVSTVVGAVDAMRFKGTVNSNSDLPTSGVRVGDTYMVNTAGTYAGQTCEVGDLIIATATTPTWIVAQTNIDGAITNIIGTSPISVSGSGNSRTVALEDSGVTAGTYDGGSDGKNTFYIPTFTVDSKGRITSASETSKYLQIISSSVYTGLMSRGLYDKTIKAPDNWYDFGDSTNYSYCPKFLRAGDTTKTWTIGDPSSITSNIGIFDVIARDKVTGEEVIVDWVSGITSGRSTLTVTIAEAYEHDIVIFPLTTYVIYGH